MVYRIFSLKEQTEVGKFCNRLDAIGFMNFNDVNREDLYYVVEKQVTDFTLLNVGYSIGAIFSNVGMTHFC